VRRATVPPWSMLVGASLFLAIGLPATAPGQTAAPPLSNAAPALRELGQQVQDQSLPEAERLALVKLLADWGTAQVREPLLALLKDSLPSIREAAARALGWGGNREAAVPLRELVQAPGEPPAVRVAALDSLGKIGDDSVREAVLAASHDPDPRVRHAALGALTIGGLAKPADRVLLMRRVAPDQAIDPWLRCEAVRELAHANDTASVPLLIRLLETEPPVALPTPRPGATQQEVMVIRHRQARDVRAWAAYSLGLLEAKEALPLLLKAAEDSDDFFLRISAVGALVSWGAPEALPVLARRLGDPIPDVRLRALDGIAKAGDRSAVEGVRMRLADPQAEVRLYAVAAIVSIADGRTRADLEARRQQEADPRVQQAIERALARLPR
jgi:HEAT repeat protein